MDIIKIAHIANVVIMFLLAIGLGFFLVKKFKLSWRLFFIGGAAYGVVWFLSLLTTGLIRDATTSFTPAILIQVLLSILFLLILAGIEEGVRYAMYRWWAKDIRSWDGGLLLGAGHGGLEVILIGVSALILLSQMLSLRYADLATVFSAENLPEATKFVANYWSAPWYKALTEAVRSGLTLPLQLACSIMILQVFLHGQYRWLGLAIGWHALASIPYLLIPEKYTYLPMVFVGIFSLLSVVLVLRFRPKQEMAIEVAR